MTNKTTLDYLVAARAAITAPENWCTQVLSADEAFCARGALHLAISGDPWKEEDDHPAVLALQQALPAKYRSRHEQMFFDSGRSDLIPVHRLGMYNNTHTHAEVLALFDRAIARQRVLEDRTLPAPLPDPEAKDPAPRSDSHDAWFPTI